MIWFFSKKMATLNIYFYFYQNLKIEFLFLILRLVGISTWLGHKNPIQ